MNITNYNSTVILGRLTHDPYAEQFSMDTEVVTADIAVNHTFVGKDGAPKQYVAYVPVVAFGPRARTLASMLKGQPLFISPSSAIRAAAGRKCLQIKPRV
jgi:single-stranded DNA-binding protein